MTSNDKVLLLLSISILLSAVFGILIPSVGEHFYHYILVILGILLFLNLIQLELEDLVSTFKKPKLLLILSITKMIIIPVTMYAVTSQISPNHALSVLLLSGISTGLGAPFVTNYVGGKLSIIVGMVIVTSLTVPFILPMLVYVLYSTEFSIPIFDMIFLLVVSLVFPLVTSGLIKKYLPHLAKIIKKRSLPLSIILMDMINFAIFSNFSIYFYFEPSFVILTTVIAILLFGIFAITGYLMLYFINRASIEYKISGLIVMSYINNILVTVFAQQFFGSQVAALATFYNIPYYMGIILLKVLFSKKVKISRN